MSDLDLDRLAATAAAAEKGRSLAGSWIGDPPVWWQDFQDEFSPDVVAELIVAAKERDNLREELRVAAERGW